MRKQRKSYNAAILDNEYDKESEFDHTNSVVAFTSIFKDVFYTGLFSVNVFPSDNWNACDKDEVSYDAFAEAYKTIYLKCTEESQLIENNKERVEAILQYKTLLMLTIIELKQ